MPFYVINGMRVHVKLSGRQKSPAPCVAHVEADKRCAGVSGFLCDWREERSRKTCDAPLCAVHAREVGKNRHYCPAHHAEHLRVQPQLGLFTQLQGGAE